MAPRCVCDPITSRGHPFNEFIGYWFGQCVYSSNDYAAFFFGIMNILLWFSIHLPQLISSCKANGKGLSPVMLTLWFVGDITGVLGLFFTSQKGLLLFTQIYYLIMDSLLFLQYIYFFHYLPRQKRKTIDNVPLTDFSSNNPSNIGSINNSGPVSIIHEEDDYNDIYSPQSQQKTTKTSSSSSNRNVGSSNLRNQSGSTLLLLSTCILALVLSAAVTEATTSSISQQLSNLSLLTNSSSTILDSTSTTILSTTSTTIYDNVTKVLFDTSSPIISTFQTLADDIPKCNGGGQTKTQEVIGIILALICCAIYFPSKVPQIIYQYKRKSTFGLSMIFLILSTITPWCYNLSVFLSTYNYDKTNGFRSSAYWLSTFPYQWSTICGFLCNIVIFYQVRLYKQQTEIDRLKSEQAALLADDSKTDSLLDNDYPSSTIFDE